MAALGLAVSHDLELVVLRPFHVFGEGESANRFWPSLREAALKGTDFDMSPGELVRDFIRVERVAEVFLEYCNTPRLLPKQPVVKNLGTGSPQTLREFAEGWWHSFGAAGTLRFGATPYRANEVMRYVPRI